MSKNRLVRSIVIAAMLGFVSGSATAQIQFSPNYSGALVYSIPILHSVPPIDSTQPVNIQTDYLWLDDAFRQVKPGFAMDQYIHSLGYGDTLKYFASILYQVVDANPITFVEWGSAVPKPYPYKAPPGRIRTRVQSQYSFLKIDTNRTPFLLDADIIADVKITDTAKYYWVTDHIYPKTVVVTCQILDDIKGKYVPLCGSMIYSTYRKGPTPLSIISPVLMDVAPSSPGTCMQFEYSPNWPLGIQTDYTYQGQPKLTDSTGDWIRKDSEYIAFLYFDGVGSDSTNDYYALLPNWGWFGSFDGLYPVRNGIVYDPNDDFGIGASSGLSVADWKSRIRARIYSIVNP